MTRSKRDTPSIERMKDRASPRVTRGRGVRGVTAMLLALVMGVGGPAQAYAPVEDMHEASLTLADAEQKLAAGDADGAIVRFEAALEQIPEDPGYAPTRALVLLTIVEVLDAAFARDGDLERLRRAKRLLDRYLGPLDLLDEQGRAEAEERRVRLIDAITAVEQKLEAEAAARSALTRQERAAAALRRGRVFSKSGAALTSIGAAGLLLMGVGFGLGRVTDGQITDLVEKDDWDVPCVDDGCREARRSELEPLVSRGNASNVLVIVGAVTGGTLLAAGVTLLVLGRKKGREAKSLAFAPTLSPTSLGLTLRGRF